MRREAGGSDVLARAAPRRRDPLAEGYLAYIAHERRLSANTLESYGRDIDALFTCANGRALDTLEVHDVRRFVALLHGKGLSPRST